MDQRNERLATREGTPSSTESEPEVSIRPKCRMSRSTSTGSIFISGLPREKERRG